MVENYLCSLPEHKGQCEPNSSMHRGFLSYIKGGIALAQNLLYNRMVTQDVAERRGEICINCPKNTFPDKNAFVSWSDDIANRSTGGRKSKYHQLLGNCDVCGCTLKAKVFFGEGLSATKKEMEEYPEACWIKKEILTGRKT